MDYSKFIVWNQRKNPLVYKGLNTSTHLKTHLMKCRNSYQHNSQRTDIQTHIIYAPGCIMKIEHIQEKSTRNYPYHRELLLKVRICYQSKSFPLREVSFLKRDTTHEYQCLSQWFLHDVYKYSGILAMLLDPAMISHKI